LTSSFQLGVKKSSNLTILRYSTGFLQIFVQIITNIVVILQKTENIVENTTGFNDTLKCKE